MWDQLDQITARRRRRFYSDATCFTFKSERRRNKNRRQTFLFIDSVGWLLRMPCGCRWLRVVGGYGQQLGAHQFSIHSTDWTRYWPAEPALFPPTRPSVPVFQNGAATIRKSRTSAIDIRTLKQKQSLSKRRPPDWLAPGFITDGHNARPGLRKSKKNLDG